MTKSVSDAKALAECDSTAEEIQTILFPKKRKARKSMEKQPDGTDRDVVSRGGRHQLPPRRNVHERKLQDLAVVFLPRRGWGGLKRVLLPL